MNDTPRSTAGLSPPTRGNPRRRHRLVRRLRSIPAHAGEPSPANPRRYAAKVYPRPRGGTVRVDSAEVKRTGLSPPTRGNQRQPPSRSQRQGSIPAHAGEPGGRGAGLLAGGVYPRPRGGTDDRQVEFKDGGGLSPPTRGNLNPHADQRRRQGSIPAHAGEPDAMSWSRDFDRVYPRPRGGTSRSFPDIG